MRIWIKTRVNALLWIRTRVNALLPRTLRRGTEPLKLCRSDRHARPLPTLGLRGAATSHKGRRAGSRPARATIFSCRLSSMAERCVVAAETLDRYRQAVPNIGRVAHRQSGGLQNRAREGSIPSSPAKHFVRKRQKRIPSRLSLSRPPPSPSNLLAAELTKFAIAFSLGCRPLRRLGNNKAPKSNPAHCQSQHQHACGRDPAAAHAHEQARPRCPQRHNQGCDDRYRDEDCARNAYQLDDIASRLSNPCTIERAVKKAHGHRERGYDGGR